ncbi:Sm-like protein lsm7 [Datura stramonium]|uniref:Sm-like protein lsm7 n=1 Tax=Datura stramonium TaxID=4076 RepID=A0ABS8RLI7_DATST|nr:Sm-like protein lsm7 [Datura stramonium]
MNEQEDNLQVFDEKTEREYTYLTVAAKNVWQKESVSDLAKFVNNSVQANVTGGRQVISTLKGYDQLLNLVLDEAIEHLTDSDDPLKTSGQTRSLGLIVCKGGAVMLVAPEDGSDEISNPFV